MQLDPRQSNQFQPPKRDAISFLSSLEPRNEWEEALIEVAKDTTISHKEKIRLLAEVCLLNFSYDSEKIRNAEDVRNKLLAIKDKNPKAE